MGNKTTWKPGQSGNPKGRPPKGRALTERLAAASSSKVEVTDGDKTHNVALKDVLAAMLWEGALTGQLTFVAPDETAEQRKITLSIEQWSDITKFLFAQVDGASPIPVDLTSAGRELKALTADKLAAADKLAQGELSDWENEKFGKKGASN